MECRQLTADDVDAAWQINEQGLPAVSYTHLTLPTKA